MRCDVDDWLGRDDFDGVPGGEMENWTNPGDSKAGKAVICNRCSPKSHTCWQCGTSPATHTITVCASCKMGDYKGICCKCKTAKASSSAHTCSNCDPNKGGKCVFCGEAAH